jgi:molybdopterin molybdotransferase
MEIEEARELILEKIKNTEGTEIKALEDSFGYVLAQDITSKRDIPSFPRSAMDGYAVHSDDIKGANRDNPVKLTVTEELCAGDVPDKSKDHGPGTTVRIMTGAYIPEAYNAVIMQEKTNYAMDIVEIYEDIKPYQNYCKVGEDLQKGSLVVSKGTRLNPSHLSLIAELGIDNVFIYKPLRTAIISTGSELQDVSEKAAPGKIFNSIAYMLQAYIRRQGLIVSMRDICLDDEKTLKTKIEEAIDKSDFIITTGGVSVGKKDIVPKVISEMGGELLFQRADIQPGTPTAAFDLNGKIVLALSGNPYAAMANFEMYYWDAAARFMNCSDYKPDRKCAILKSEYTKINKHRRLLRAYYEDGEVSLIDSVHASSVISNLTKCNCYIDLEAGRSVQIGDSVRVQLFK